MRKTHQPEKSETSLVEQTRWPDRCYDEGKLKYPACIPEGLASRLIFWAAKSAQPQRHRYRPPLPPSQFRESRRNGQLDQCQ